VLDTQQTLGVFLFICTSTRGSLGEIHVGPQSGTSVASELSVDGEKAASKLILNGGLASLYISIQDKLFE